MCNLNENGFIDCNRSEVEKLINIDSQIDEEVNLEDEGDKDVYKSYIDLTADDIFGLEFASKNAAYKFYFTYAKCHGFGIRKDEVGYDDKHNIVMRQYLCNKAGLRDKKHLMRDDRKKEHRPLSRTDCKAKLRVRLDRQTSKFKVVSFEEGHNHNLCGSNFVQLICTYRGLTFADKVHVDSLHAQGVRTCHIMGFMLDQTGGHIGLNFNKKDLFNHIERSKRFKIKDGDVVVALSYLQGKADNDPLFFQGDESIEAYRWVLESFLNAMSNKQPKAVVTDGDGAMREAIKQVFPEATHRLCSWHLQKNVCQNVKNNNFWKDFKRVMYSNYTPEKFERLWNELAERHELQDNNWVQQTYQKRFMWATAYLCDNFFAGIRTTSLCEGINSCIKSYLKRKNTIVELLYNFEHSLRDYRYNELFSDFNSFYTEPILSTSLVLHNYNKNCNEIIKLAAANWKNLQEKNKRLQNFI
uniref:Protein FAR1-RELATED SEQUENCE 7 n=1 Tax=Cajanus cajan TaxID=3821 RepID=A0A151TSX8_CAJCA|nr:Protein FAR1-RELATED SEQUENCE 7 [Cajanus cajan]